jgi:hypothetical protein
MPTAVLPGVQSDPEQVLADLEHAQQLIALRHCRHLRKYLRLLSN